MTDLVFAGIIGVEIVVVEVFLGNGKVKVEVETFSSSGNSPNITRIKNTVKPSTTAKINIFKTLFIHSERNESG